MGGKWFVLLGMFTGLAAIGTPRASAAHIDSNLAVSPATRANGGGCYPASITPTLLDMLVLLNPEWAPVDVGSHLPPFSDPITIHGTVALAKFNDTHAGDFPGNNHVTSDQLTYVVVDPAEQGFVATGNVGPDGVEAGQLEVEWEIGKYPLFAWAGTGDRLTGVGRWIWDCGHPGASPVGSCSTTTTQACIIDTDCASSMCPSCVSGETCVGVNFNYHSELHPPQAVAITRTHGYAFSPKVKAGRLATRADVWISPDGGGAGDQCAVTHLGDSVAVLAAECYPLTHPLANVNASNFSFTIPLPPKPAGTTKPPRVKIVDRTPKGLPRPAVTTTFVDGPTPVVNAVVNMTTPIKGKLPSQVGKTIVAGWLKDPTPITRVRIVVTAVEILNPLKAVTPVLPLRKVCSVTTSQDCSSTPCPSGETCVTLGGPTPGWQMFLEANGDWRELPGLDTIAAPGIIPQNVKFDLGLAAADMLHLHASGHSLACWESQLFGRSLARDLALYGLSDGATCLSDFSKEIGTFDLSLPGPDFGSEGSSATYATQSVGGDGGHCSTTTSQLCLTAADCPDGESCTVTGGAFKLHYTITKLH